MDFWICLDIGFFIGYEWLLANYFKHKIISFSRFDQTKKLFVPLKKKNSSDSDCLVPSELNKIEHEAHAKRWLLVTIVNPVS